MDNANGTFMSAHIEHIGITSMGPMFSVAHYCEQNGDLMKDPDMTFLRGQDQRLLSLEFQQDNLGLYQPECVKQNETRFSFNY